MERNLGTQLKAIGGDSTNVNTGWEGGVMQWVERKLRKRLVWIVCDLHTNELGLRHLIISLDGPTKCGNKWSGILGKMLNSATSLEINPRFTKIDIGPALIVLSPEVINGLSTDQSYAYRITKAIKSGDLPQQLAMLEIGPVCHSRWLTTALRFCRIWVSQHGLYGINLQNLTWIVEYIVGVYIPNWFNIKVKSCWVEGPRHVLYKLELLRSQREPVLDIVMPTIKRSAWYAHSEAILQAMICSDSKVERGQAVEIILKLREKYHEQSNTGGYSHRHRRTPDINIDAKNLFSLIDWSNNITEPPLTCNFTSSDIKDLIDNPMVVPQWNSHTQSVERCVKMVTEAAGHVHTSERREAYIRAQFISRELMSANRSKKDMMELLNYS
jgi:hypothetical protein